MMISVYQIIVSVCIEVCEEKSRRRKEKGVLPFLTSKNSYGKTGFLLYVFVQLF
jgi:hypothetical protein